MTGLPATTQTAQEADYRHGALISSRVPLRIEMKIAIHVVQTKVLMRKLWCGIALEKPENIWGVSFPPDDWYEHADESES